MSDKTKHYSVSRAQWTHFGFHAVHTSRNLQVNQNSDILQEPVTAESEQVRQLELAEEI